VPPDYNPRQSWPLIVFLHGASRRGADGEDMVGQGLGPAIAANPERFPCIVVMPQCPKGQRWDTASNFIDTALDITMREFSVDQSRVYLTGCSMGGFGIFYYGSQRTALYAAMMPIAGGGRPEHSGALADVPVWVFHNAGDRIVPVKRSRTMVEALERVNGNVRYTEYPDPGHDAWTKTYNNPEIIDWLLSQRKS
jgi:predicted peptidase